MTLKPWTFAGISLCVLIIGAFLGHLMVPHPQTNNKNKITVTVENGTNKINLSPQEQDVIRWVDQADHPVQVRFLTDAPCQEIKKPADATDICTVNASTGNFQYVCTGPSKCVDPGVDPRSDTGQARLPPPGGLVPSTEGGSVVAIISCPDPNGTPVVTWVPDPPGSTVNVNENIVWKSGSLGFTVSGFSVQNTPVQLCSQPTVAQTQRTCTVVKDTNQTPPYRVTYTVTTSGKNACGSTSPTLTVNPAPQPSTPTPQG